jgi:hypothetical protein
MTVAKPLTQREIESLEKFGFGFVRAEPKPATPGENQTANCPLWNFDEAIGILARQRGCRIKTADDRARCKSEISLICHLYALERFIETQETDASKASAFQKAPRWDKPRQRAIARLEKAVQRENVGLQEALAELRAVPWLAQSLEQEAAREAKETPLSGSFKTLQDKYKRKSRRGKKKSHALTHTIHRLQALASQYAPNLSWGGRDIPPALLEFILETLAAAEIKDYPGFVENPSKFRRLMSKLPLKARSSRTTSDGNLPAVELGFAAWASAVAEYEPLTATETELERRLLKTPI